MKQLTIISGKGGTGKTSIAAAFATLANHAVFADCDVDAADLHLILKPTILQKMLFHGLKIADINKKKCTTCGQCINVCKFDAITENIEIIKESCEGCGVCAYICPVHAINMVDRTSGFAYISNTRFGPMAHAALNTAEEASGKLVTLVRKNATMIAEEHRRDLIIIDGPPGIGCPVIASLTGVDLVLIITEPTLSAIHDLKRIHGVANHFDIPTIVCINKFDINQKNTTDIEHYCKNNHITIVGKLPYDTTMTKAMIHEQSIIEYSNGMLSQKIQDMWKRTQKELHRYD